MFITVEGVVSIPPVLMIKIERMGKLLVEALSSKVILLLCIPSINPLWVCAVGVGRAGNAHTEICLARKSSVPILKKKLKS